MNDHNDTFTVLNIHALDCLLHVMTSIAKRFQSSTDNTNTIVDPINITNDMDTFSSFKKNISSNTSLTSSNSSSRSSSSSNYI